MINMISTTKFDAACKTNAPTDDRPDTDSSDSLFASVLTGMSFVPAPTPATKSPTDGPPNSDPGSISFESPANPASLTDTDPLATPEDMHQNPLGTIETTDIRGRSGVPGQIKPTGSQVKQVFPIRLPIGIVPVIRSGNDRNVVPTESAGRIPGETIAQNTTQEISLAPIPAVTDRPVNTPIPSAISAGQKVNVFPVPTGSTIEIAPQGSEVVSQPDIRGASLAAFASEPQSVPVALSGIARAFREASNLAQPDNSPKIIPASDPSPGQTVVELTAQTGSDTKGDTLSQSTTSALTPEKELKQSDSTVETAFDTSLGTAVKMQKTFDIAAIEKQVIRNVLDQVEPKVLDLMTEFRTGNEKRVMKMRLNPAELGAVEITIEKGAGGRMSTHFQTESQHTRQILSESLSQLRESLERSGINVGDMEISCGSFSSAGSEERRDKPQKFGTAGSTSAGTTNFDGISTTEDDATDRLVNLRA